jgi:hypothetical protein
MSELANFLLGTLVMLTLVMLVASYIVWRVVRWLIVSALESTDLGVRRRNGVWNLFGNVIDSIGPPRPARTHVHAPKKKRAPKREARAALNGAGVEGHA